MNQRVYKDKKKIKRKKNSECREVTESGGRSFSSAQRMFGLCGRVGSSGCRIASLTGHKDGRMRQALTAQVGYE